MLNKPAGNANSEGGFKRKTQIFIFVETLRPCTGKTIQPLKITRISAV